MGDPLKLILRGILLLFPKEKKMPWENRSKDYQPKLDKGHQRKKRKKIRLTGKYVQNRFTSLKFKVNYQIIQNFVK